MFEALSHVDSESLRELANALKKGRLSWPNPPEFSLATILPRENVKPVHQEIVQLCSDGFSALQTGILVEAMAQAQEAKRAPALDLVWTGPDMALDEGLATLPVVNELFKQARKRVLITGYALFDGKKIFEPLVQQLQEYPELEVLLVLNISRKPADTSTELSIVSRWKEDFLRLHWKSSVKPKIYYDPRSLSLNSKTRAVMHAKCVVVDGKVALISSANLTEAAQRRNIEAGLLVKDFGIVRHVEDKFSALIQKGFLRQVVFR